MVKNALDILRARSAQVGVIEGYRKDGPVAVARFELGEGDGQREARALRQREASDVIERLLARTGHQWTRQGMAIPLIDLPAGPGGLGDEFASHNGHGGKPRTHCRPSQPACLDRRIAD